MAKAIIPKNKISKNETQLLEENTKPLCLYLFKMIKSKLNRCERRFS